MEVAQTELIIKNRVACELTANLSRVRERRVCATNDVLPKLCGGRGYVFV